MKIAHIIDALGWGGAQTLLLTFAETASRRGIEVLVIGLKPDRYKPDVPDRLRAHGAQVIELSYRKIYDPRTIPALVALLKKERVDLVHTHLSHANILGSVAANIVGLPVVTTLHNTNTVQRKSLGLRKKIEQYCLRNLTSRVIAVGENVAGVYRPLIKEGALDVIPNAVGFGEKITASQKNAIRAELAGDADRLLLLAVGRLLPQKGYHDMLTAFARLHERFPKTFLAIVGVGELQNTLLEYTRSLGLSVHVRFLGERGDVPQLLAAADVFLNSSHWEGLSIAMLEAMMAGLPVVATSVGDAAILLSTGGGVLSEPKDPAPFALAMESAIIDPEKMRSMGRVAREYVERNYAADSWLDKLLTCYALSQKKSDWLEYQL